MFRQDRTNPSTKVSQWRGRSATPKGWPSTRVSTWQNGGLFGAAGAGSAMEPIETSTSTAASLTFTSIPQTYKHLWFVWTIPGNASNWGNFYGYAENSTAPTGSASLVWYQYNATRARDARGPQGTGYGLKMAAGDDNVGTATSQYHEFTWMYYSDPQGSGTTTRWSSAIGQGYGPNPGASNFYQYLTAWNEDGASTTVMPITELTMKFGDGSALPSGTTRTLYGIN